MPVRVDGPAGLRGQRFLALHTLNVEDLTAVHSGSFSMALRAYLRTMALGSSW